MLRRVQRMPELSRLRHNLEAEVRKRTKTAEERRERMERLSEEAVLCLSKTIDAKDKYTRSLGARGQVFPGDRPPLRHHERYGGGGYPDGISGENIPVYARIIGVADAYDAMTSKRSYRDVLPQNAVKNEINIGTQFDPTFSKIMLDMIEADVILISN